MFSDRPLTWLFVIATICVDFALFVTASESIALDSLKLGFQFGQIAALSIWAVRGNSLRLIRASCLVLGTGLLASLSYPSSLNMGILFIYAVLIYAFTLAVYIYRGYRYREETLESAKPFQVPLIEFFGLTIVVAIASYFVRNVDFNQIWEMVGILDWIILLAIPGLFITSTQHDLRDIGRSRAFLIVAIALVASWTVGNKLLIIVIQMAYITSWMLVIGFDSVVSEVASRSTVKKEPQEPLSKPKLFNPQD